MEDNNLNLKYNCNHPQSAFGEETSSNPIEMKKENFIEYTRRNEKDTYKDDYWAGSTVDGYAGGFKETYSTQNYNSQNYNSQNYSSQNKYSSTNNYSQYYSKNPYNYNTSNYRSSSTYSSSTSSNSKKKSSSGILIFIILWFVLPVIFSILEIFFEILNEVL